jgi:hypothetical protein
MKTNPVAAQRPSYSVKMKRGGLRRTIAKLPELLPKQNAASKNGPSGF